MRSQDRRSESDKVVREDAPAVRRLANPATAVQRYGGNRAIAQLLTGQGEALDPAVRADMQAQLGASVAGVRVPLKISSVMDLRSIAMDSALRRSFFSSPPKRLSYSGKPM